MTRHPFQVEILMKWINFLKERGEITEEKHAELLRAKESFLAVKLPGRRISSTGRPGMRYVVCFSFKFYFVVRNGSFYNIK